MSGHDTGTRRPRLSSPLGLVLLVVALVLLPIAEITLLVAVGRQIGLLPTVGILLAEVALGAWLSRREGSRAWRALSDAFGTGRMPTAELTDAALVLTGGVMLMLPGFLTDVFGLVFLLPFTRPLARKLLAFTLSRQVRHRYGLDIGTVRARMDTDNTIRGETVDGDEAPGGQGRNGTGPDRPGDRGETITGEIEP